jgi:hypothetical protein
MKNVAGIIIAVIALAFAFVQHRKVATLRAESAAAKSALNEAKAEAQRLAAAPKSDPKEDERITQERAELAKLRGEVSALRKEKAEWEKNRAAAESAALSAAQQQPVQPAVTPAAQGMQWVETIMNGPALVKGTEVGNVRRKALAGEQLTEAEASLLMNMNSRAAEIEKVPDEFANFQSAYIASLLGWTNDPRSEAIKGVITAASNAALQRGFDFNAPAVNADKWDQAQKNLNTRATGAVQNLLKPEERAVFDKALIGVLGVDTGLR